MTTITSRALTPWWAPWPLRRPENFERRVHTLDTSNRIHFTLTAPQAASTAMLRVTLRLIWGYWENASGIGQKDFGEHQITLKVNGTTVRTQLIRYETLLTALATDAQASLLEGEMRSRSPALAARSMASAPSTTSLATSIPRARQMRTRTPCPAGGRKTTP